MLHAQNPGFGEVAQGGSSGSLSSCFRLPHQLLGAQNCHFPLPPLFLFPAASCYVTPLVSWTTLRSDNLVSTKVQRDSQGDTVPEFTTTSLQGSNSKWFPLQNFSKTKQVLLTLLMGPDLISPTLPSSSLPHSLSLQRTHLSFVPDYWEKIQSSEHTHHLLTDKGLYASILLILQG